VRADNPDLTVGRTFGMPSLTRADGRVVAMLRKDGAVTVKFADEDARTAALGVAGARVAMHAFDPSRPMVQWVDLPPERADEWERLVRQALLGGRAR
jgi:hypothetical protein